MGDDAGHNTVETFPWHIGVYDAHCHPTDVKTSIENIPNMKARTLTVMATRQEDQQLVANAARELQSRDDNDDTGEEQIVPSFGWHPWFAHLLFDERKYDGVEKLSAEQQTEHYKDVISPSPQEQSFLDGLKKPVSLSRYVATQREYLQSHPYSLVGEVGLDKSFRLPEAWSSEQLEDRDENLTSGGREGRRLSPHKVDMEHQKLVLQTQLRLAGELGRACSVHGVQAHGLLYNAISELWAGHERKVPSRKERKQAQNSRGDDVFFKRPTDRDESLTSNRTSPGPYPPRICLHSYSGTIENLKQYYQPSVPAEIYVSFSEVINFAKPNSGRAEEIIKWLQQDKILIESDLHKAGDEMDAVLEAIARRVCRLKGWTLDEGLKQLAKNWKAFVYSQTL